jgi:hypothetical protein
VRSLTVLVSSYIIRILLPFVSRFTSTYKTIKYYFPIMFIFITIKEEMVRIFTFSVTQSI